MADYYPLLVKALDAQPGAGRDGRRSIYARARTALASQLRILDPPLDRAEIAREEASLENAIARLEAERDAPSPDPFPVPEPEPAAGSADPSPRARRVAVPAGARPIGRAEGRRRALAVFGSLCLVGAPVAGLAWLWRDDVRPTASLPEPVQAAAPAIVDTAPKRAERLGGVSAPARSGSSMDTGGPSAAAPARDLGLRPGTPAAPAVAPPVAPAVTVAQSAVLYGDGTDGQPSPVVPGRTVWRLDTAPGGQGLPLETVVRCLVDLGEGGFTLAITMRRNTDAALPASHTIELVFTPTAGERGRSVRDVGLPSMRLDDTSRGLPLSGLPVPVKENLFLIGLSDTRADVERNTELLVNRGWMEIPLRFATGQKAVLLLEKGVSGSRVVADAFRQWGGP